MSMPLPGWCSVEAGIVIADLGEALARHGLAMENQGDIDHQSLAGAISTATHGTGVGFKNISAQVEAVELVLADGSIRVIDAGDPDDAARRPRRPRRARCPLLRSRCAASPPSRSTGSTIPRRSSEMLAEFDRLADTNDHFEFYVFPHTDVAAAAREQPHRRAAASARARRRLLAGRRARELARRRLRSGAGRRFPRAIPRVTRLLAAGASGARQVDRSHRIFANERRVRFTEMEYGDRPRARPPRRCAACSR